jgi:hypothetical protein
MIEIEERCIEIACANTINQSLLDDITYNCLGCSHDAPYICDEDHMKLIFLDFSKKVLTEYQNQLKKINN